MWFGETLYGVCRKELGDSIADNLLDSAYFVDFLRYTFLIRDVIKIYYKQNTVQFRILFVLNLD